MMDSVQWLNGIRHTIAEISSESLQARSWFGRGPEVSSPDEMYDHLYDDLAFHDYFALHGNELTDEQRNIWRGLDEALQKYSAETPTTLDPLTVFNDRRWHEIRRIAETFVKAFGE